MKILTHDMMATSRDGEGVGLDCSCGWEWHSCYIAEDLAVVVAAAQQHMVEVAS